MLPKKLYTQGSDESDQNVVSFITGDFSNDGSELDESVLLETIPILPLRNTIVFPGSGLPISVGRSKSLNLVRSLGKKNRYIGLVCQKDTDIDNPEPDDLYQIGVIAEVLRVIELADDNLSIIIQAKKRFEWTKMVQTDPFFVATYKIRDTIKAADDDKEYKAILDSIRDAMIQMLNMLGEPPKELMATIQNESFSNMLVSYCATNLPINNREKQELLNIDNEKDLAYRLLMILNREIQILELKMNIKDFKAGIYKSASHYKYFLPEKINHSFYWTVIPDIDMFIM